MTNGWRQNMRGALTAGELCGLITLLCQWLVPGVSPINLVMIYLLGVVLIAIAFGRIPSVWRRRY